MQKTDIFKESDNPLVELFPEDSKKSTGKYINDIYKVLSESLDIDKKEKKQLKKYIQKYIKGWDSSFIFDVAYIYLYFKKDLTKDEQDFVTKYIIEHESKVYTEKDDKLQEIVDKQQKKFDLFSERLFSSEKHEYSQGYYTVPQADVEETQLEVQIEKDLNDYFKDSKGIKLIDWEDHIKIFQGKLDSKNYVELDILSNVIIDSPLYTKLQRKYDVFLKQTSGKVFLSDYLTEELLHSFVKLIDSDIVYTLIVLKYLNYFTHNSIYWSSVDYTQANIQSTVRKTKELARKYLLSKDEVIREELKDYMVQYFVSWWD